MGLTTLIIIAALVIVAVVYFYLRVYRRPKEDELELPYTQGLAYLLEGEIDKAREKFHEAIRKDSENLQAYLKLGAILRQKGQAVAAIKVHQSLTVRPDLKQAQKIEIFKELAQDFEQAGALKRAAETTDQILQLDGNHLWALSFGTRIAEKLQDWTKAFHLTRKLDAIENRKDTERLALYRVEEGRALMDRGRGKEGRIKCREALRLDRSCAYAYLTLAKSYIKEKREEDAVKELKNLMDVSPEKAYLAYDLLENLYFNLGRFGEIERLYREIISTQPQDLHAAKALARLLEKKGDVNGALKVCSEALERHPDDLWTRRFMIRALVDADRIEEIGPLVIEVLDRVLIEQPRYTCSHCGYNTSEPLWRCPKCSSLASFDV